MRYKWKCYAATSREFLKRKYECLSPYFFFVPSYYVLPGWSSSNRFEIWGHTLRIVEQQDRRRVTCQWRATFLVLDCFTLNFFHMREKKNREICCISFFKIFFIYLSLLCWVFISAWIFSSCGKRGRLSGCSAWASLCCAFSCCGALVRTSEFQVSCGSTAQAHGLSCSKAHGIFPGLVSNLCLPHWQMDSSPLSHREVHLLHFYTITWMIRKRNQGNKPHLPLHQKE